MSLASVVMMGLGAFRFGVTGPDYQELRRAASFRYGRVERIGRRPALQYVGPGAETITISGVIYPHYKGGLRQVEAMRLIAGLGRPMYMVDGLGWFLDRWVITSVEETRRHFLKDGSAMRIDFSMTLEAYGDDKSLIGRISEAL